MNAFNGLLTKVFNLLLVPLELLGNEMALILLSGIFGVLALVVFKHISSQDGISGAKEKIKAHMIAIRLYQDDLWVVAKSIGLVLWNNVRYVTLNFGPFIPLMPIFLVVVAQTVVRYSFEPIELVTAEEAEALLPGQGTLLTIEFKEGQERKAGELEIIWPEGLVPQSKLVRISAEGKAWQEFVALAPGDYEVELKVGGDTITKTVSAGTTELAYLQPERVSGFLDALLWPAEETIPDESPIALVKIAYPDSDLGWLPMSGVDGVLIMFVLASIAFGLAAVKPLGVQI
ncbi:MAG: hypothetical protein ACI8X5_002907 [Planctomycetota bacterium]|jgi:hypothetical protein